MFTPVLERQTSPDASGQPPSVRSIHDEVRQDIVSLKLRPGTRLSENELAQRFGTSRAPVREALIRLAEEGLIDVKPQRGSFVSRISLSGMERARFVREALEVAVARRAAEIGISEHTRIQAENAIAAQHNARESAELFTAYDDAFHRSLAEGIGLVQVWAVVEREKAQLDRVRFLSLPRITPVDVLISQHRAILAAIMDRNIIAAEAAVRLHMSEVLKVARELAISHPDLILGS